MSTLKAVATNLGGSTGVAQNEDGGAAKIRFITVGSGMSIDAGVGKFTIAFAD